MFVDSLLFVSVCNHWFLTIFFGFSVSSELLLKCLVCMVLPKRVVATSKFWCTFALQPFFILAISVPYGVLEDVSWVLSVFLSEFIVLFIYSPEGV